jgi:hypothetical protein
MARHHARHRRAADPGAGHELFRTGKIDLDYLIRYTNAPWLVIDDPDGAGRAFRARRRGRAAGLADRTSGGDGPQRAGREAGAERPVRAAGRPHATARCLNCWRRNISIEYAPAAVRRADRVAADTITRIAGEIAAACLRARVVIERPWTDMKGERHDG